MGKISCKCETAEEVLICPGYHHVGVDRQNPEILQISMRLLHRSDRTIEFYGPNTITAVPPIDRESQQMRILDVGLIRRAHTRTLENTLFE